MVKGKSPLSSLFKLFKVFVPKKSHEDEIGEAEYRSKRRRHYNDDDGAELEIDNKSSAFINRFHASRVTDSEWHCG